jgi:hypothetical protein
VEMTCVRLQEELQILKDNIKHILKNHNIRVWIAYIWFIFMGRVLGYCELSGCQVWCLVV